MTPAARAASLALALLAAPAAAEDDGPPARPDLLSFAQGALLVDVSAGDRDLRITDARALLAIDGAPGRHVVNGRPAAAADVVEYTFALPAPTRFDRFAVPVPKETRSPSQTFFAQVEVLGAAEAADGPWTPLAAARLPGDAEPGALAELALAPEAPEVRWVRLRLQDGLDVQRDEGYFEFSEIIGEGVQRPAPLSDAFTGVWSGRGVKLELKQDGATVEGCYDGRSRLSGTVSGPILRALGADEAGVASQFILIAAPEGAIRGLRSTNGAPFTAYDGAPAARQPVCLAPEPPSLGCGSVVHGIGFDFDSDVIRPESSEVIAALHAGLAQEADGVRISIIGHSSSEGARDYNQDLSQRRAASVAAALAALGLAPARLSAEGRGEDEPIASNADEAGRSLNRRVEVRCAG